MRLDRPFLQLPVRFDAEILAREAHSLPNSAWLPHPQGYPGNDAVPLVSPDGEVTDDIDGAMAPTKYLEASPYIRSIMADLDGVWGRSRLMGLAPGGEVRLHVDVHYYWRTHLRIHIPVITNPDVRFTCGGETVHMAAGECWLFDSFRWHRVENGWTERRVHLVLDTVLTPALQLLVDAAKGAAGEPRHVAPDPDTPVELRFEQFNAPAVMTHWEMRCHLDFIFGHASDHPAVPAIRERLERFTDAWAALWAEFGSSTAGLPAYRRLLGECRLDVMRACDDSVRLTNDYLLRDVIDSLVFAPALGPVQPSGNVTLAARTQLFA